MNAVLNADEVQEEVTEDKVEETKQAQEIGVQSMDGNGKKLTANKQDEESHAIRARLKSGPLKVLLVGETEKVENEVSTKSWVNQKI